MVLVNPFSRFTKTTDFLLKSPVLRARVPEWLLIRCFFEWRSFLVGVPCRTSRNEVFSLNFRNFCCAEPWEFGAGVFVNLSCSECPSKTSPKTLPKTSPQTSPKTSPNLPPLQRRLPPKLCSAETPNGDVAVWTTNTTDFPTKEKVNLGCCKELLLKQNVLHDNFEWNYGDLNLKENHKILVSEQGRAWRSEPGATVNLLRHGHPKVHMKMIQPSSAQPSCPFAKKTRVFLAT